MPLRGPGLDQRSVPSLRCHASLSISESVRPPVASGFDGVGNSPSAEAEYDVSVTATDGIYSGDIARLNGFISPGGFYILTARFVDAESGEWTCLRFFYVTVTGQDLADSSEVMIRSMKFHSSWLQETVGGGLPPSLDPVVLGEVEWRCGSMRVVAMTYDPAENSWTSTPQNEVGDGSRYVNFSPLEDSTEDAALAAYFPRVEAGKHSPPPPGYTPVVHWRNLTLAVIGSALSTRHHGLALYNGIAVQQEGIVEPLLHLPQSRMLDEPMVIFRFLRRVYAVIGHGVLALPRLVPSATELVFTHDHCFRLGISSDPEPLSGMDGMVITPTGAWLSGTATSWPAS